MASRIDQCFSKLAEQNQAAFVTYITAGDPTLESSLNCALALEKAGADVLELGVPFSDPLADGPTNQMAADRALKSGTTLPKVLELVSEIRKSSEIPIVLFTYLNPIYTYGYEKFLKDAAEIGVDGILNLDLPPDEASLHEELNNQSEIQEIRLISPTTPPERALEIAKSAEGFIYYVCQEGVTGARSELASDIDSRVQEIQEAAQVPVSVGFGISTTEQASQVAQAADGVVVGSALVNIIAQNPDSQELPELLKSFAAPLAQAIHQARE